MPGGGDSGGRLNFKWFIAELLQYCGQVVIILNIKLYLNLNHIYPISNIKNITKISLTIDQISTRVGNVHDPTQTRN